MKIKIVLFFFLFYGLQSFAQKEAAIWYFGENAGLDFNSGAPVALTDGALDTTEGCATISDFNGNLLFYTDGITVWDRNHNPMPNGTGLNGHPSSTQSGIIVPSPGNPDQYYVLTVDWLGEPNGLQYNIVDITLNGGLGDVTAKNQLLETPMTEKVTAVAHANGSDIWVLSHRLGSNEFVAYLVTAAGLNPTPVISAIGSIPLIANRDVGGYLKLSPDGSKVAYIDGFKAHAELFSFDNATGVLSNAIALTSFYTNEANGESIFTYGAEFSSDSKVLYISHTKYFFRTQESKIYQFDLSAMNAASIMASATQISDQSVELGALQLGIDGKIYVAQREQNYLGVINNPNTLGVGANYIENGVSLSGRISQYGLPPFITTYFVVGIRVNNFCLGDITEFEVDSSDPIVSISWDFGDGNTSILENPTHTYAATGNYTVNVTVNTATDSKTETRDIEIYDVPVANTPIDYEVCNVAPNFEFELSTKDSEVLGVQSATDYAVAYFVSQTDADNNQNPLPNLYTNTNAVETIYARIHNVRNSQCYDVSTFDLVVKNAPSLVAVDDWVVCDTDTDGIYIFDLNTKDAEILNGQDASSYTVEYYASQAGADAQTNLLPVNYTNSSSPQEVFYRIYFNTATDCYETGSFMLEVIDVVVANTATDMVVCDDNNDGHWTFDLSTKDTEILGTQNVASLNVTYHTTQADADANTNAINKTAYANTTAYNETIYVRIENNNNTNCYDTTTLNLQIDDSPQVQPVTDWDICDDNNDGFYNFDFTQKDGEILGGQSVADFSVSYYVSQADADADQNAISSPYTNITNPQDIFYRLENNNNTQCYLSGSFTVEVFETPTANMTTDMIVCDDNNDGLWIFDLSTKDMEVLGTQNATFLSISYYATQTNADTSTNALSKAAYTNTTAYNETIYVRIENSGNTNCYDTTTLNLQIDDSPEVRPVTDWDICDDNNDGFYSFDLTQKDTEILGGQSATDFSVSYYVSQADADADQNAISSPYTNITNPQDIFYRLENNNNTQCYLSGSFTVEVFNTPTANAATDIVVCDDNETGMATFDFSSKDMEVLALQDANVYEVFYFGSQVDADANTNALNKAAYVNAGLQETIYTRVQHRTLTDCYDTSSFTITINLLPQPALEETYVICSDNPDLTIDGGDFETWQWRDNSGSLLGSMRTLDVVQEGDYSLTVTIIANGQQCEKTVTFAVLSSGVPEDFTVTNSGFSDMVDITIDATGLGDFEYSVNGTDYQDANEFRVHPGTYTVYVRDRLLCRILSKEIVALGYRKFFTPNGDLTNDSWNILGAEHFPDAQIFIYDRLGKVVKQLSPTGEGWDGTYRGRRMPESDYWFSFEQSNGKIYKGHFALKR